MPVVHSLALKLRYARFRLLIVEPRQLYRITAKAVTDSLRNLIPRTTTNTIKNTTQGGIVYCGGDEGIRTLDTLASIPHFQCGALDQLCDVS